MRLSKRLASLVLAFMMALSAVVGVNSGPAASVAGAQTYTGYTLYIGGNQLVEFWYQSEGANWRVFGNRWTQGWTAFLGTDINVLVKPWLCDTWTIHQSGTGGWSYFQMKNSATGQDDWYMQQGPYLLWERLGCTPGLNNSSTYGQSMARVKQDGTTEVTNFHGEMWINTSALTYSPVCTIGGPCTFGHQWVSRYHYWT